MSSESIDQADNEDQLRGIEGYLARQWFSMLQQKVDPIWQFIGRNRRPPKDPVNALLSLSYTLMLAEVQAALQQRGLDVELGFLHEVVPGRPSLALDIMEPLRPLVDTWVMQLIYEGRMHPLLFQNQKDAVLLNKDGRKAFYGAWYQWVNAPLMGIDSPPGLFYYTGEAVTRDDYSLKEIAYTLADSFARLLSGYATHYTD